MAFKNRQNDKNKVFGGTANQVSWVELLRCSVCNKEFNRRGRLPVSLGCGHTYCQVCLVQLQTSFCQIDQVKIEHEISVLPVNTAILQLKMENNSKRLYGLISPLKTSNQPWVNTLHSAIQTLEELALFLKLGKATDFSRPMQRKLIALFNNQLIEAQGRQRVLRLAKALAERVTTELICCHQSPTSLASNLWDAVRARGCQFLGPAMQEEALKLIQFALEDESELSRKVLVQLVVEKLQPQFPQASKTSIGHVVQLLYRASCFIVTKREGDSSLMRLKDEFLGYEELRKEHDAQIVQIAREAGLRISPDQWSALLYGDPVHKSYMQSIIDRLQSGITFNDSIKDLVVALERSSDPGDIRNVISHLNMIAQVDIDNSSCDLELVDKCLESVTVLLKVLCNVTKNHQHWLSKAKELTQQCSKYKTSMCRDYATKGVCPRGEACTFAHSEEELQRYRNKGKRKIQNPSKNSRNSDSNNDLLDSIQSIEQPHIGCSLLNNNCKDAASSMSKPSFEFYTSSVALPEKCCHCNCVSRINKSMIAENCSHKHQEYKRNPHDVSSINKQRPNILPNGQQVQDKHIMHSSSLGSHNSFKPANGSTYTRSVPSNIQMLQPTYISPSMKNCHVSSNQISYPIDPHQRSTYMMPPQITYMSLPNMSPPLAMHQQQSDLFLSQSSVPLVSPNTQHMTHNFYVQLATHNNEQLSFNKQTPQLEVASNDHVSNDVIASKKNKGKSLDALRRRKNEVINKLVQKQIVQPKHEIKSTKKEREMHQSGSRSSKSCFGKAFNEGVIIDTTSNDCKNSLHIPTSWNGLFDEKISHTNRSLSDIENDKSIASCTSLNDKTLSHKHKTYMSSSCEMQNGQYNIWDGFSYTPSFNGSSFGENSSFNDLETHFVNVTSEMGTKTVMADSSCKCDRCSIPSYKLNHEFESEDEIVPIQNLRIVSKYGPIARTVRSKTTPAVPEQVQAKGNAITQPIASHDKRSESNFSSFQNTDTNPRVCTNVEPTSLERPGFHFNGFSANIRSTDDLCPEKKKEIELKYEEEDLLLAMELQQIEIDIQSKLKSQA